MKKKVIIAVVIVLILALAIVIAVRFNGSEKNTETKKQTEASTDAVPEVLAYYGNELIGRIEGYTMEMNIAHMRDVIIPINSARQVPLKIQTKKNKIQKISYEVYDLLKDNLVDSGDVTADLKNVGKGVVSASYVASPIMEKGKEYSLKLIMDTDRHKQVYYYTRIMIMDKDDVIDGQLKFVKKLSDDTFSEEKGLKLQAYLEPDSRYSNDDLGEVTIRNILKMLLWGSMNNVERVGNVETSIKDIHIKETGESVTYTLLYRVRSKNAQKKEEQYNIAETITAWNYSGKTYVLAYNREMNQIWEVNKNNVGNAFIDFGIQKQKEVNHVESDNGKNLAWDINGEVYSINTESKKVQTIFTKKVQNADKLYKMKARVMKVDDDGNVEFMIYGYSPSDKHIGENGISIMKYNVSKNESTEVVFIPTDKEAQVLEQQMSELCYEGDKTVYIMLDNTIYFANMKTKEFGVLAGRFQDGACVVNDKGNMVAYNTDCTLNNSDSITIVNLTNGSKKEIYGNGKKITVCGYTGENLVYGLADSSVDKYKRFPITELKIVDKDFKEVKQYSQNNVVLSNIEVTDSVISFKRWKKGKAIEDDQLLNNTEEKTVTAKSSYYMDDIKMKELALSFVNNLASDTEFNFIKRGTVVFDKDAEISADFNNSEGERYFVYGHGRLIGVYDDKNAAINVAKDNYGLICNNRGSKIWTFEDNYKN